MRKHNEGYTLAMVMVVIVVLCLVTVSVLTASMQNLKAQRTSLDRLNAKYQAQGQVETLIGRLEQGYDCETVVANEIEAARSWLDECGITVPDGTDISVADHVLTHKAAVTFEEKVGEYTYTVDAVITITATIEMKSLGSGYTVSDVTVKYTSYEIGGSAA